MTQPPSPPWTEPPPVEPGLASSLARLDQGQGRRSLPPAESWFDGPPPEPVQERRTDGFSVAGFVLAVVGVVPLSVPLGIIGLRRTRRTGVRGRSMAVSALVLSGCWAVIFSVLAGVVISGRDAGLGRPTAINDLRVNQCFDADLDRGSLLVVRIADCAAPHAGEAYARVKATLTGLDSADKADAATHACASSFQSFVGRRYEDSSLDMYYVVLQDRAVADGNVLCMVGTPGEQLTGSMRGSRR